MGPGTLWYPVFGDGAKDGFVPKRAEALRNGLKRLTELAGLPYLSPHKARHGNAVRGLLMAKTMAEYKAISQNLMHSSIGITDKIYAILSANDVKSMIANLGKGRGATAEINGLADEIAARVLAIVQAANKPD